MKNKLALQLVETPSQRESLEIELISKIKSANLDLEYIQKLLLQLKPRKGHLKVINCTSN